MCFCSHKLLHFELNVSRMLRGISREADQRFLYLE